jgi:competence protein ComEA
MSTLKSWLPTLIGILLGLVFSGILLIVIRSPQGEPLALAPSPTKAPVFVHISGAVENAGVYSLPEGSRIIDLISAAGGFTEFANKDAVNLAEIIKDGSKVHIANVSESAVVSHSVANQSTGDLSASNPMNINTASAEELEKLPGIGPAKAEQIVEYRHSNGKFLVIEDIMNVPGIGPSLFAELENLIVAD